MHRARRHVVVIVESGWRFPRPPNATEHGGRAGCGDSSAPMRGVADFVETCIVCPAPTSAKRPQRFNVEHFAPAAFHVLAYPLPVEVAEVGTKNDAGKSDQNRDQNTYGRIHENP